MPEKIIQFQVIPNEGGGEVVWVLTEKGKLYYRNSATSEGKWFPVDPTEPIREHSISS